jgi:hypothetical protein
MSMRTFLFASDALRIEDGVTFTVVPAAGPVRSDPSVGAKNAQAMQVLMGGMAGLGKRKR